jgi:hypothetical protein
MNDAEGYLFRPIVRSTGRLSTDSKKHLVGGILGYMLGLSLRVFKSSKGFIKLFREALGDIGFDQEQVKNYSGHSFRRGGCQWLSAVKNWKLSKICDWGSWAGDIQHSTVWRYIINDFGNPYHPRADYLNPNLVTRHCNQCGRDCPCTPFFS